MKGILKVETIEEGLSVETALTDVSIKDKLMLLDAVSRALNMSKVDIMVFARMAEHGIFDDTREVKTVYDHSKN